MADVPLGVQGNFSWSAERAGWTSHRGCRRSHQAWSRWCFASRSGALARRRWRWATRQCAGARPTGRARQGHPSRFP